MDNIHAATAYVRGGTGAGVRVAVIDSGIDLYHTDLDDQIVDGHDIIDGADMIRLAERELMTPLDQEARRLISSAAQRVSIVTAVSPGAIIDGTRALRSRRRVPGSCARVVRRAPRRRVRRAPRDRRRHGCRLAQPGLQYGLARRVAHPQAPAARAGQGRPHPRRQQYWHQVDLRVARTKAEDSKVSIRAVRRKAKDALDKLVKDKESGEDEVRRAEKELDDTTAKYVAQVDELLKHKEAELLEV